MKRKMSLLAIPCLLAAVFSMSAAQAAEAPAVNISSGAAILLDEQTGQALFAKGEHTSLAPASVTKLMAMLLVMEEVDKGRLKLSDVVTAGPEACKMGGSQIWLEQGEQMTVADLMKAVSIVSANDAAVALAETIAGSEDNFVRLMNKRARELGMRDTIYVNASGLTPEDRTAGRNLTSAYDQALLAREMLKHQAVLKWTGTWIDHLRGGESFLRNTNNLVRFYDGCDGLKTGFTEEAGFCLVATAKKAGVRLIAVVMNAPTAQVRSAEISRLFNYGFSQLKAYEFYKGGEVVANLPVRLGRFPSVPVKVAGELSAVVKREIEASPKKIITLPEKVTAPVRSGKILGYVTVMLDGQERGRVDLVAAGSVPRSSFWQTLGKIIGETLGSLFKRG